jgi:small GTP-binding protein
MANENPNPVLPGDPAENPRNVVKTIWQTLPESDRINLQQLAERIPSKSNMWRILAKLAADQAKFTMGNKTRVAIVGPANAGKSTLYNQFVQGKDQYYAQVSPIPGTTREVQEGPAPLFDMVDTPGADAAGEQGEIDRSKALNAAAQADFLVIIFDAWKGIKKPERELFATLRELHKPYIVVLNKMDLVRRDLPQITQNAAQTLGIDPAKLVPISAKESQNLAKVLFAIATEEPLMMAALGRALPQYRWQLAWKLIVSSASLSGAIALTPLPLVDFIPLLINQSSMVMGIARIYNYKIDKNRARELVITFGLGFLGRTIFYQLSKLGGVPGWLLSAAVAASMTVAMGYAAVQWFEKGEKLSRQSMAELTKKVSLLLLKSLKGRGSKKHIKEELEIALQDIKIDQENPLPGQEPSVE